MIQNLHIIQKQVIEISVPRQENRLALQQRFEQLLEDQLLPRLEPVFDRLAGPDVWIELDKLEVDLGYLDPQTPASVWLEEIFRAYTEVLEEKVRQSPEVKRHAPSENTFQILSFFLKKGFFPWWSAGFDLPAALKKEMPSLAARIMPLLADGKIRSRWVRQFGEDFQEQLWNELAKSLLQSWIKPSGQDTGRPISSRQWQQWIPELSERQIRNLYWEIVWEVLQEPAEFEKQWPVKLVQRTMQWLPGEKAQTNFWSKVLHLGKISGKTKKALLPLLAGSLPLSYRQWREWLPASSEKRVKEIYWKSLQEAFQQSGDPVKAWLFALVHKALSALPAEEERIYFQENIQRAPHLSGEIKSRLLYIIAQSEVPKSQARLLKNQGKSEEPDLPPKHEDVIQTSVFSTSSDVEEGIFVPLAGTVLLHPFLPAFFQRLDLLEEERFREEAARERAVHLLYFLATGRQHPAEEEVVLLKILCGVELDFPIEKELDLSPNETKEAEQLLQAVINNWEALQGSDPDDLRGSFLIREGKLETGEMGWKLTVEQKPYDILLSKLPWGLSPVMHSWMEEMIWVEWG